MDVNADLGEGFDDAGLMAEVTSANVACGGHAGDAVSMRACAELAVRYGVAVGAHPSYADREGFGRRAADIAPADLRALVSGQIDALREAGADVRYVKPHGALYNRIVDDEQQADAVARAAADARLPLLGLPGSAIARRAEHWGVRFVAEGFPDRGYLPTGALAPRGEPGAVITDPDEVAARAVRLATTGGIDAVDGSAVRVDVASLCVHGDTPDAPALARAVRRALASAGVETGAFA